MTLSFVRRTGSDAANESLTASAGRHLEKTFVAGCLARKVSRRTNSDNGEQKGQRISEQVRVLGASSRPSHARAAAPSHLTVLSETFNTDVPLVSEPPQGLSLNQMILGRAVAVTSSVRLPVGRHRPGSGAENRSAPGGSNGPIPHERHRQSGSE